MRKRRPYWHTTERWCFTVGTPDGKRRTIYDRGGIRKTEKAAAREWMTATLEAMEERQVSRGDYTVNDLRLIYLTWVEAQVAASRVSPLTFDGHRKQLKILCKTVAGGRAFGARVARTLTARDVEELKAAWPTLSPTTVRNRLASLMAVLNWSAESRHDRPVARLIPAHPLEGIELPKSVPAEGRYAPPAEVAAFVGFAREWADAQTGQSGRFARMTALLIRVVAETGCRPGELCKACWEHFRPEDRLIVLPPALSKTGSKTGRSRIIVLTDGLTEALAALKTDPDRHPSAVFTHRSHGSEPRTEAERRAGEPWNSSALSRRVKEVRRAAVRAGVLGTDSGVGRMHLYLLRHTYATNAVQNGASIAGVAGLIGNSAKVTEQVYLHRQVSHLHKVAGQARGEGNGQ